MIAGVTEKLEEFFADRAEVQFAILFGSTAKGETNGLSDVDIAVMVDPQFRDTTPYGYQATLIADLMHTLERNDVRAVILNKARIMLRYQVLLHGKFVHIRDMEARIQFQAETIDQYEDFRHLYKAHEEVWFQRWEKLLPPKT